MIPRLVRVARGFKTAMQQANDYAAEQGLPPYWNGGVNFNQDYRMEYAGWKGLAGGYGFKLTYKPDSPEEVKLDKLFVAAK